MSRGPAILTLGMICTSSDCRKPLFAGERVELPPRDVPEGLSSKDYLNLGIKYKSLGWTEQARDAFTFAQEIDSDGDVGATARRYLRTKIPRYPVPLVAEQKNIQAFNLMAMGDTDAAKKTFEELIRQFPDFEWPYGNLSVIYLEDGQTLEAKELLARALKINPNYVNGWLQLATAKGLEEDFDGAEECVNRALESDPEDSLSMNMKKALSQLKNM